MNLSLKKNEYKLYYLFNLIFGLKIIIENIKNYSILINKKLKSFKYKKKTKT